jgi:hypothetical protein
MPGRSRRDLALPPYFSAAATGPQGGSVFKRGRRQVEATVRYSDGDLPVIEVRAYLDAQEFPCVRIRALRPGLGTERVVYDGPFARALEGGLTEIPAPGSSSPIASYRCLGCRDLGWRILDARPDDHYLGEIRACECGFFPSDREALVAARAAGLSVDDLYQVLCVP